MVTARARSLQDLAALKKTLQERERAAAEARERAAQEAARLQRERNLFALSVGPVMPLRRSHERADTGLPRALPEPRQRELDEAAVLRESISDEFDVESLLETDDQLSFRRPDIPPEAVRKLRRGVWVIQAHLDLHGLRRDEAREALGSFLHDAVAQGLRCVRVVHGKGHGSPGRVPVLKTKVRGWLVQKSEVIAFVQAKPAEGGAGALVVLLAPVRR